METWRETVRSWFPDLYSGTYCVPPVYFLRVPYDKTTIAGQTALLTKSPLNTESSQGSESAAQASTSSKPSSLTETKAVDCVLRSSSFTTVNVPAGHSYSQKGPDQSAQPERKEVTRLLGSSPLSSATGKSPSRRVHRKPQKYVSRDNVSQHSHRAKSNSVPSPRISSSPSSARASQTIDSRQGSSVSSKISGKFPTYDRPSCSRPPPSVSLERASQSPHSATAAGGGEYVEPTPLVVRPTSSSMWTQERQSPLHPVQVFESDIRDDFAQQHVLHCLQELGRRRQEVMFVLSQLNFSDYLNKPAYAAAAAQLPLPEHLPRDYQRGDFDVILIHRHHGILIGEIKAIGLKNEELNKSESGADAVLAKRVEWSIKQLDKSEKMVNHLVSDVATGLSVKKTLILPYVTTNQLRRVLSSRPKLEQALCLCLGVQTGDIAQQMCVCSEQLSQCSTPWYMSPATFFQFQAWWERRIGCDVDSVMTDDVYLNLISRFCGPASTVSVHCVVRPRLEVRTLWEAVSEVGERIAQLVVTPEQQDLLSRLPDMACLTGPPGVGKSLGLVLAGLLWLRQGVDVHVISTNHASLAASLLIYHQLKLTLQADSAASSLEVKVVFHDFDFLNDEGGVKSAVDELVRSAQRQRLCVLMDESTFADSRMSALYQQFVDSLFLRIRRLCLWAAAVRHANIPTSLQVEPLTVPLRSAPAVVREIERGRVKVQGLVHDYISSGTPSPSDGPGVVRLRHEGAGHVGQWPVGCAGCGREVARALRELHVGVNDASGDPAISTAQGPNAGTRPPPLQYRDVFVLTRSSGLHDDVTDSHGHVTVPASGVVLGLREAGMPVHVIRTDDKEQWRQDVADIAVAQTDRVTVAWYGTVFGLERKIVVCLPGRWQGVDHQRSAESVDTLDRIFALSRCTAQLILVDVPEDNVDVSVPQDNADANAPQENVHVPTQKMDVSQDNLDVNFPQDSAGQNVQRVKVPQENVHVPRVDVDVNVAQNRDNPPGCGVWGQRDRNKKDENAPGDLGFGSNENDACDPGSSVEDNTKGARMQTSRSENVDEDKPVKSDRDNSNSPRDAQVNTKPPDLWPVLFKLSEV